MLERLHNRFSNSRRKTQARKPLEKEKYETWFHDETSCLHMAEVSFLIAKTTMCKRSLSFISESIKNCFKIDLNSELITVCALNLTACEME